MVLLIRAVRNTLLYIFCFSFASFLFAVVVRKRTICCAVCFSFLFFSHIGAPDVNQAIGCLRWGERRHELLLRFSRAVSSSQSHCRTRVQRYIQKMRPAKRGLILGNIRKNFRKEWRILVYFPRKDSERIIFPHNGKYICVNCSCVMSNTYFEPLKIPLSVSSLLRRCQPSLCLVPKSRLTLKLSISTWR